MGGLDQYGRIYIGSVASVSGTVYRLDGAAFTVSVDRGDGGDAEDFRFAAGATSFDVSDLDDTAACNVPSP